MGLVVTVQPTVEPLTVAEVAAHLRIGTSPTNTLVDPELSAWIIAARQYCETFLGRALITRTLALTLDRFPCWGGSEYQSSPYLVPWIPLPRPNLLTVSGITYVDPNGDTQTLATSVYSVDTASLPGRVLLKYGQSWPSTRCQYNAVTITYTAGYGPTSASVPETIKAAMKLLVADWYENRESTFVDLRIERNPTVDALLWSERFMEAA